MKKNVWLNHQLELNSNEEVERHGKNKGAKRERHKKKKGTSKSEATLHIIYT